MYTKEYSDIEGIDYFHTNARICICDSGKRRYVYILAGYAVYEQDVMVQEKTYLQWMEEQITPQENGKPWSVFKTITWNL